MKPLPCVVQCLGCGVTPSTVNNSLAFASAAENAGTSKPLRVQCAGRFFHVLSRGNE